MKRFDAIPSSEHNGLYWYFSNEYWNGRHGYVEPVLVYTRPEEGGEVQMLKRFNGGSQRYMDGYLLGPVLPPIVDVEMTEAPQVKLLA